MDKIIVYTVGCPKCKQLEKRLTQKNISFDVCTDVEEMKRLGISSAPYLSVNGELKSFAEAWKWLTSVNEDNGCKSCEVN